MNISGLCWHLLEGFSRCRLTVYSPSITIGLAELLYIQPALADPADSADPADTSGYEPATDLGPFRPVCCVMPLHQYHVTGISIYEKPAKMAEK